MLFTGRRVSATMALTEPLLPGAQAEPLTSLDHQDVQGMFDRQVRVRGNLEDDLETSMQMESM